MKRFWCEAAWLDGAVAEGVLIDSEHGMIAAVGRAPTGPPGAIRIHGLAFPGFANTHSHAFQRALRGRAAPGDSFWSWREAMFRIADRLDPDSYLELATGVFAEMTLAGFTLAGEFHYVHHRPGGKPYDEPNAMGLAVMEAARRAGIRLTLLDACYLQGGINQPLAEGQLRFADPDADSWAQRRAGLPASTGVRIGAAIHSVRTVPREALGQVARAAGTGPVHVHLSEQIAENEQSLRAYGCTPTALLEREGVLGQNLTAVHAIHLTEGDIRLLAETKASVCACPTTEADLGDGIGPFATLHRSGVPLAIGTDQHGRIDAFLEVQRLEMDQRLRTSERHHFSSAALLDCLTATGYRSLGWPAAGVIAQGALCDLTVVRTDGVTLAGVPDVLSAASAADVDTVIVGGETIVSSGIHRLENVASRLQRSIDLLY